MKVFIQITTNIIDKAASPILHLNLVTWAFDAVLSGNKKEEYREIKPYWDRIFADGIKIKGKHYPAGEVVICFSNGYAKDRRQFKMRCTGLKVGKGNLKYGGDPDEEYYVLGLGEMVG